MNRQAIDLDDLRLTAYSLGEMPDHERSEFERQLARSPLAQRELEVMDEVMSMLTDSLKNEWREYAGGDSASLELVSGAPSPDAGSSSGGEDAVVPMHNFGRSARSRAKMLSLAAVLTGMLVVGSLVLNLRKNTGRDFAAASTSTSASTSNSVSERVSHRPVSVDRDRGESSVNVPALLLAEEVKDFDTLVADLDRPVLPVNDSYLDDGGKMIQASYGGIHAVQGRQEKLLDNSAVSQADIGFRRQNMEAAVGIDPVLLKELGRADSYLPAAIENPVTLNLGGVKSGIVSDRTGKERMKTYTRSASWSGSGRLNLLSAYDGMQADLADVVRKLETLDDAELSASQISQVKRQLRGILEQGKEIGRQLAR